MPPTIDMLDHAGLTAPDIAGLRALFDAKYHDDFGEWNPDRPYGYSPADFHVVARQTDAAGERIVGHVGIQRRRIRVGEAEAVIAGTGGVLVARDARGTGLGEVLLEAAARATVERADAEFGYLGCREAIVPFSEACGWTRIHAEEVCLSRLDGVTPVVSTGPLLIRGGTRPVADWPAGPIVLRGTPW
ncbi:GNAT family N-acetyltransferase [Frondihabitans cladoniiphilus]|uniref:Nodulation protein A n=1 Tax=Frondihabitans cladoniiphilus TaxID=715785 RepID=A0ABP8VK70_9MICO